MIRVWELTMTLFTKSGNWFLRNSRNVLFLHVANYIVIFVTPAFLYCSASLILRTQEARRYIEWFTLEGFLIDIQSLFATTLLIAMINIPIPLLAWIIMSLLNRKMIVEFTKIQFWIFQISYPLSIVPVTLIQFRSISLTNIIAIGGGYFYFLIFWLIIEHLRRKTITQQEEAYV